jgi:hypothetical protein
MALKSIKIHKSGIENLEQALPIQEIINGNTKRNFFIQ